MSPSSIESSTPVIVTIWVWSQFALVKVSVVVLRLPSVASRPVIVTVTSLLGWLLSLTVKLCWVPDSLVVRVALLIVRPAESLSAMVAVPVAVVMLSLALVASAMLLRRDVEGLAGSRPGCRWRC